MTEREYLAYMAQVKSNARPELCPCCQRLKTTCDADAHGCGTTPAEEEKQIQQVENTLIDFANLPKRETWRDRPPLL